MADPRQDWLAEVVCSGLDVDRPEYDKVSRSSSAMKTFLDESGPGSQLILHSKVEGEEDDGIVPSTHLTISGSILPDLGRSRAMFIIKNVPGPVAPDNISSQLSFSIMPGNSLTMLSQIMTNVFIPIVDPSSVEGGLTKDLSDDPHIRSELTSNINKFVSQIQHTEQQVGGDILLQIPNVELDVILALKQEMNVDLLTQLEATLEEWSDVIASIIETETVKEIETFRGPLGEINFWRNRNAILTALTEQLNSEIVQSIIAVLADLQLDAIPIFKERIVELGKLFEEAKDNVKFLSTLERHFKKITGGSVATMAESISSMMNALRMVWIISRHYNKDERMVPLMCLIAQQIATNVANEINIKVIFRKKPKVAMAAIETAREVLLAWFSSYKAARLKIESLGMENRWEFDRKKLFDQTNYMARICENLCQIAETLSQFNQFLGSDLKRVTKDTVGIDEVIQKVDHLVTPLENLPFNIFDIRYNTSWEQVMKSFNEKVLEIEIRTKNFITNSFQKLRSAESAFQLLWNFNDINTREAFRNEMSDKFKHVLRQYRVEVERVQTLFQNNRNAPPLPKNQPPVAGSLAWAMALYLTSKKTILKLQNLENLMTSEVGKPVAEFYLEVAQEIDHFRTELLEKWKSTVHETVNRRLKDPILARDSSGEIVVNFSYDLVEVIRESRYMDRQGLSIPRLALDVSLQSSTFHASVAYLNGMLSDYRAVIFQLNPVEKILLRHKIEKLNQILAAGFDPLNWNSLGISDFIHCCNRGITEFNSIVNRVTKNRISIKDIVTDIESADLFNIEKLQQTFRIEDFRDSIEKQRRAVVDGLVRKYSSIHTMMLKIEESVNNSDTGKCERMSEYYRYWEENLYQAICQLVSRGLSSFLTLLGVFDKKHHNHIKMNNNVSRLLLVVIAEMNPPDIVYRPTLPDIYKFLSTILTNIVSSSKGFIRWMNNSCIDCPAVQLADGEEKQYTFYDDVSQNPAVIKVMLSVSQAMQRVFNRVDLYVDTWRKYDQDYHLWNHKKMAHLERIRGRPTGVVYFDNKLLRYASLHNRLSTIIAHKDIDFIRVDCMSMIVAVKQQAEVWLHAYGEMLRSSACTAIHDVSARIAALSAQLTAPTDTLEQLQAILSTIVDVRDMSMDMELLFMDLMERFRTLRVYNLEEDPSDYLLAMSLPSLWHDLVVQSRSTDRALLRVKQRFMQVAQDDVSNFAATTEEMKRRVTQEGPIAAGITLENGLESLRLFTNELEIMSRTRVSLENAERLFGLDVTPFPHLQAAQEFIRLSQPIYDVFIELQKAIKDWSQMLWIDLDIDLIDKGSEKWLTQLNDFKEELNNLPPFRKVQDRVVGFRESIPLMANLKNPAIRQRHWDILMAKTGIKFDLNPKLFTLGNLFAMQLNRFKDDIDEITMAATQEARIEKELAKIVTLWSSKPFPMCLYRSDEGSDGLKILQDTSDVVADLEDGVLNLQTMLNSRFIGCFADDVRHWERDLNHVIETIDVWMLVQKKWMYLEGIFIGSDDIRMQLRDAAKSFDRVDADFKKIMSMTGKNPNVLTACSFDKRIDDLRRLSTELDQCQKSLSDYLERKRNAFPRFFFISDDELLSILGTTDPNCVQIHMLKLFDNVKQLRFARGDSVVGGMVSSEGESFSFKSQVATSGPVEVWMTGVEEEMTRTLQAITKQAVFNYPNMKRGDWIKEQLGMVGIVGGQIWWTWEVEDGFRQVKAGNKHAVKQLAGKLTMQLSDLVAGVRSSNLDVHTRKKVNTMIIIDVHARDIVDRFVRDSILDAREFDWESQLRFYWRSDVDDIRICQCTGVFRYGYEYMGLNGRLVITPLTDRCYMTLTQALTFNMGGSPAGPAGTGKTETVKDLAKALALLCMVTNCGDGLDYRAMSSIFSGLVQAGAWGCFDEFNRIDLEVLSVVSTQLRCIQMALKSGKEKFDFGGREIRLRRSCGFFITMNPGYAGRTELPDNLKALFRPVTMVVPDLLQICEIMLFSEGFSSARMLAKKMTVLYKLSREQLSKQCHYDFGLRALKSVLVMAGALKRGAPEFDENMVLMRALRDMNLPKFVYDDVPLFLGLINDLFPGIDCPRVGHQVLTEAVRSDMTVHGYKHSNDLLFNLQIDKTVQLYETMLTRHTCMIVGPTRGGKTVVIETLARSQLAAFGLTVKVQTLNPKAQSVSELYGVLDPMTRDWTDGILSKLFRETNEPLKGEAKEVRWIVFDGDVDALWVENMNSVMDDNKLLTLPNGERIRLQEHVKLLVEVADLQHASPATVSRCGMVYVDPKNLGHQPFLERWTASRSQANPKEAAILKAFLNKYIDPAVDYALNGSSDSQNTLRHIIPLCALNLVDQFCSLFSAVMGPDSLADDEPAIESLVIFCVIWSVGAALQEQCRPRLDQFIKQLSGRQCVSTTPSKSQLPSSSLFQWYFEIKSKKWVPWSDDVSDYAPPSPFKFNLILVPTVDTVCYSYMLKRYCDIQRPFLLVGASGTAKTVVVQKYLEELDRDRYVTLNINFSSRTSSLDVQRIIEDNVDKRTGHIYGPQSGKKLVVFFDDLNMPHVDKYGTQQPIALLKFLLERGIMYDRGSDLALHSIRDLLYISAMAPPGGGRNPVDPRFISSFAVINIAFPSSDSLQSIYSSILDAHLDPFPDPVKQISSPLTSATMKVYQLLVEKMAPTPSKFHYVFNLRDLSRVYQGLCLSLQESIAEPSALVRLWRNECLRVFHDRLISDEDRRILQDDIIGKIVKDMWPSALSYVMANPILYGDFRLANNPTESVRIYEDLGSYEAVRTIFDQTLSSYNSNGSTSSFMNLVLFQDALEHLTRIHRIIRMERGNALLVGVGGSGKQSLTRLAACCAQYSLFVIQLSRGYGEYEFREDLKKLYSLLCKQAVVFMFSDAHVVDESFLELVNNMLTTGIVPALFSDEEKAPLIESVRKEVPSGTADACWAYLVNKCRDNLHIVLCMSPSGDQLRRRCRSFPGLVCNTVIDWFFTWPSDALLAVANHFLAGDEVSEEFKPAIVQHMVKVHLSVQLYSSRFMQELRRFNSVTPKNYLDYIGNYRRQLSQCRIENDRKSKRLIGGLAKLIEAADAVDAMQEELREKKVIVDAAAMECTRMIEQIRERSHEVEVKRKLANEKNAELQIEGERIAVEKKMAEDALDEALPALEAAAEALKNLKKDDITMVKSYANPPGPVKDVCQCVLELKPSGKEDPATGWAGAKSMMSDPAFLSKLQNYPRDDITEKQVQKVTKILKKKTDAKSAVTVDNLDRISAAGKGLLVWVLAILDYNRVAKNVEPRRKKVKAMEKEMAQSQADLRQIRAELGLLEDEIAALSKTYEEKSGESRDLALEADKMAQYLAAASKLIQGLGSERTRWSHDKEDLSEKKSRFVGDCLLAAAFLSYTGAFTFGYRSEMLYADWQSDLVQRKVPLTSPFRLETLLTTPVQISSWVSEGLPSDELSIQNGILTTQSSRFPLCIDPQMQALKWIKEKETRLKKLTIQTFNDPDFMKYLELCIQFGNPFLFEAVDEDVDPIINPVLDKNLITSGSGKQLQLGDKLIDWDDGFRLYLVTKMSNPEYSAELAGRTMIINYSVTMTGLEDQLLDVVVGNERPDLQQQREELIQTMSKNNIKLAELEAVLLRELTEATGNILENAVLIGVLESAKTKSVSIAEQLEESAITANELEKVTAGYRAAAKRGAILFFAISGLSNISKMYEYSLSSYLQLFLRALTTSERDPMITYRLKNIITKLTKMVYDYVCTGIFERHKLMFSFQMTVMIMEDELDRQELDFFLKGNISLDSNDEDRPDDWISAQAWKDLQRLSGISEVFTTLLSHVTEHSEQWRSWQGKERPEDEPMPEGYGAQFTKMQSMLILRCFRPDRIYTDVRRFVVQIMGDQYYVQPPVLEFGRILAQSSAKSPVVFILSPGADPMIELDKLAEQHGIKQSNRFRHLALGQGQGDIALSLLKSGSSRGFWIVLQNCHLMSSWLKTLEKLLESLSLTSVNPDFRLWLTTDPTPRFPLGILQRSLKVVTEPPDGLRLNIRSSYSRITDDVLNDCPHPAFPSLVYVLSFFHAVVQERRKYGKIGWNVMYDFNESDFNVSLRLLSMYLTKAWNNHDEMMPWGSLRYLIGEAMYGGRVTDSYDRRILITYLDEYMGDFLFDQSQPFYFSRSGYDYMIPATKTIKGYEEAIQTIPLDYSPEVFGLHSNAEIGYFSDATKQMWRDLIDLQPRSVADSSGASREEIITRIAADIERKVPEPFDLQIIRRSLSAAAATRANRPEEPIPPCAIVLMQELERWNILIAKMSASLAELQKALAGEIGMSSELEAIGSSLFNGYLPEVWRALAPQTKKMLGSWIQHFQRRYDQYQNWILQGDDPIVIWLSGLHVPESYLTALVQSTCRKRRWPLDKSTLYTKVTGIINPEDIKERPADGCYIQGLYLEGAGWDVQRSCLTRPNPKELIIELPILQVIPIELTKLKLASTFRTPVYVTQDRRGGMGEGAVFEADLTASEHASHWILQGTALVLNTD